MVVAVTNPVDAAVGGADPHGKANTCHSDATLVSGLAGCVQVKLTDVEVMVDEVIATGFLHVGGGAQVTFATHPGLFTEPSLLKRKVRQPSTLVEVNGPGNSGSPK